MGMLPSRTLLPDTKSTKSGSEAMEGSMSRIPFRTSSLEKKLPSISACSFF